LSRKQLQYIKQKERLY